ncbi:diguanylate cyclase [Candidatus Neomarinimicrobiota bacterium]
MRENGKHPFTILAFCPKDKDIETIQKMLNGDRRIHFTIRRIANRDQIAEVLEHKPPDTVLLSIDFREEGAMNTLKGAISHASAPIVIIAENGNERWAVQTLKEGGYDYLPKTNLSNSTLADAIIDAHERWRVAKKAEELQAELAYLAVYDVLTEVFSRRAILAQIKTEIARSERHGRPLSLIMSDIDHFKIVNDTHGHVVGDMVLKQFASTLLTNTRRSDYVGRYGGEEFLILLPESSLRQSLRIAEKLRKRIAILTIPEYEKHLIITASFGVCEYQKNMSVKEFIQVSDQMMYQAKENGRNQVQPSLKSPS